MQKRLFLLILWVMAFSLTAMSQVTTSGITGKVTANSEDVIGATIKATHEPTGSVYLGVSNEKGRFTLQGLRAGGPYTVEISYVGYETKVFKNVNLKLGEVTDLSTEMKENAHELDELVVTGRRGLDASKTGAAFSVNSQQIRNMPSIDHSISDMLRSNPQIQITSSGAMSFAGINNRYNSFQIDGAVNNDVFGLTKSGSNGGQAGAQPVSMETIDQIQVNIAPFDVRQSGFTGGAINAITKSGTNEFHGSVYGFGYNQNLIGKHYKMMNGNDSQKYDKQDEYNIGVTLGGPIIKNKLFFFANLEKTQQQYDNNYGLGSVQSKVDPDQAKEVLDYINKLASQQGASFNDVYSNRRNYTRSTKAGLKLDWNINDNNKASFRWSYVDGNQLNATSTPNNLVTSNYNYNFASKTHTFVGELHSTLSPSLNNELRATYMRVRDERQPGSPEPMIQVKKIGDGSVTLGNEYSSMANNLDQDMFQVSDNLTWYKGDHTFTFGTHNEFYHFKNLFIQNAYGCYYFNGLDDLKNGVIDQYYYNTANTEVTGDPRWAPQFGAGQLGFYAQDKWNVTDNLEFTLGIRADIPLFFNTPTENAPFNEFAVSEGWNVKTNHRLSSTPLWSPRLGFRWDINGDRRFILRGGVGVFTGRIPFVWLSNNFSNTGIQMSTYQAKADKTSGLSLILDPNGQQANVDKLSVSSSQTINVFDNDFKFAQNLKFNLGFDANLLGIDWTIEGIYSKTLNDIVYKNLAYEATGKTLADIREDSPFDNRPLFNSITYGTANSAFQNIYMLTNTNKGYSYNLSIKAVKHFDFGLDLMASYTYSKSKSVNSGTSSVAASNWNFNYTHNDPNSPELTNSAFNIPHTINASVYYHTSYGTKKEWMTTVGLIYQGRSGAPYSIYYDGDINGDYSNGNDLIFIPTDAQIDKMEFSDFKVAGKVKYSASEQRNNYKAWLAKDPYLSKHRGEYYERYADNEKFEHHFDLHLAQKYSFKVGAMTHSLELSFDVLNIGNMFNKKWGRYSANNGFGGYYSPISYTKQGTYQFAHDADYNMRDYSDYLSRWRGQLGIRYTF